MYRLLIASRYLRSRPIMWISMVGVVLGIGSILVVDSILRGFVFEHRRILHGTEADLKVYLPHVADAAGPRPMRYETLRRELLDTPGVAGVAPRLSRLCLLRTDRRLPSVVGLGQIFRGPVLELIGIEPQQEATVSGLPAFLAASPPSRAVKDLARPLAPIGPGPPILLGDRLAQHLELAPGDRVEVLTYPEKIDPEQGGQPLRTAFHLAGTFRTRELHLDLRSAYVRLQDLQRFSRTPYGAHEVAVRVEPGASESAVARDIMARLRRRGALDAVALPWFEVGMFPTLLGAVENQRRILNWILFCIVVVAGFNLVVTLNMMVAEKRRDIGVLSALGASPAGVASVFTGCGLLVTLVGVACGLLLGTVIALNINPIHELVASLTGHRIWREQVYGFLEIPVSIDPVRIGFFAALTVLCTVFFSLLASWRAARLDAVVTLRAE